MGTEHLDSIFNPKRIAVVGASDREGSVGARVLQNLVGVGFSGSVYPVNPFRSAVQGITAYPSVTKIPWQVDLAVVATPAHTVPQIVDECGKAGILGVVIISAGFKEVGEEGKALEEQVKKYRNQYGMRIIGPNSFGVMRPKIKLNATFANRAATLGKIAFISQSAALCATGLDFASEAFLGFSAVVSTGGILDVDFGDLVDYFGADAQTRSIVLYVESINDARKFMSAARSVARIKPIIVAKAGRFPASAEATYCHAGALCGEDAVYDAAFRRVGVVRVEAMNDLFHCAETLAMQPNPRGTKLAIISNAGAPGIIATDSLVAKGGELSKLSDEISEALRAVLPSYCSVMNPLDILEDATPDRFKEVMEICFKDPNADGFLVIYTPQGKTDPITFAKLVLEVSGLTKKPMLTVLMGEDDCWKGRRILRKNGIPAFATPELAVSTFMYMYGYTQNLELLYQTPEELSVELSVPVFLKETLRRAAAEGRNVLGQHEALRFLEAYRIPTLRTVVARTSEEAEVFASELGFPVVMKALSPQIIHKSRAEAVILNVWSSEEVQTFFQELRGRVKQYDPSAEFEGVIIQPMVRKMGHELLIGSKKDQQFGSVILFGTGGVNTEVFKDFSVGFPPLNQVLSRRLMERTAIYEHMTANESLHNVKLLEEVLVRFSQLVIDFPEIKEMDINPVVLYDDNAVAVDARITVDLELIKRRARPHEHLVIAPYPKRYVREWKLKDGSSVVLRPVKPEDEALLSELFSSLSEETKRFRFFNIFSDMSHESLIRHCNLDYDREIGIVAEMQQDGKKLIGAVGLVSDFTRRCGEFAVVVGDQWQGKGLGSKLIDYVVEIGKDMGLETVVGYVISRNTKMIDLCVNKGFVMEQHDEETMRATLKIS